MTKILLVTPDYHCGVVESAGKWLNAGFVYMAGELRRHGHEVHLYDAMTKGHSLAQIRDTIAAYGAGVVATSAYTSTVQAAAGVLQAAKEVSERTVTVMGGVHPSFLYREVLERYPQVDFVVRGEGEVTFPELVDALEAHADPAGIRGIAYRSCGKVVATPDRPFTRDLDSLSPAWDLVDWRDYTYYLFPGSRLAVISTSRGCMHDCRFCSQQKFWHQSWRARSVASVTAEIELLAQRHGVDVILIADELPTFDRRRWEGLLDWLIERDLGVKLLLETRVDDIVRDEDIMDKYRRAGVVHIYVGVEATSQEVLDYFHKGILENQSKKALQLINDAGIITETSFVLGTPHETRETISHTLALAKEYNPDFAHFLLLAPWPYADMYEELKPYVETFDYSRYNLVEPVIRPIAMTREELFQEVLRCYREFYFHKLPQWARLKDPFKKAYALNSMKVILNNSFLTSHLGGLGKMPQAVKKALKALAG